MHIKLVLHSSWLDHWTVGWFEASYFIYNPGQLSLGYLACFESFFYTTKMCLNRIDIFAVYLSLMQFSHPIFNVEH